MSDEVYCNNCKWFKKEKSIRKFYCGAEIEPCYYPKKEFYTYAHDCKDYKRKWWKIWV